MTFHITVQQDSTGHWVASIDEPGADYVGIGKTVAAALAKLALQIDVSQGGER